MARRSSIVYTVARRLSLTASFAFIVGVPAWHLARFAAKGGMEGNALSVLAGGLGGASVAPPLQGAPWSVNMFGLELLDPLAALGVALTAPSLAILVGALPTLLLVVLLGRFYCGWLCPYVPLLAASKAARNLLAHMGFAPRDVHLRRSTPLLILITVLAVTAVTGTHVAPLLYPPSVIGREVFKAVALGGFGLGLALVGSAFVLDTFVSRAGFCRWICPGGALFSVLGALSPITVRREQSACIDCGICDRVCGLGQQPMTDMVGAGCERCGSCVAACPTDALGVVVGKRPALLVEVERLRLSEGQPSRRAFVGASAGIAIGCAVSWPRDADRRLRPPGALAGTAFDSSCIRCFRCAEVCPVGAIQFDSSFDIRGTDTPWINPAKQACILCMACTQVCPTGALTPLRDELISIATEVRMGTAIVSKERCIAWNGTGECNACWQVCPFPDRAVRFDGATRSGPVFDRDACVGCGLCQQACPSRARAITIEAHT